MTYIGSIDRMETHREKLETPVAGRYDVIVAGAGPAGCAAAVTAARDGAKVLLVEAAGCLGGVWTAGLLAWVFDVKPDGFARTLLERLNSPEVLRQTTRKGMLCFTYDVEAMKLLLEQLCAESGVDVLLHTRVAGSIKADRRLEGLITESKSGRQAWRAKVCIDCTGDGDLGYHAGCGFEIGSCEGDMQPGTMMAAITVRDVDAVAEYIAFHHWTPGVKKRTWQPLTKYLLSVGIDPSYHAGTLFQLRGNLLALMVNHQYGLDATDAASVTRSTMEARAEIHRIVDRLARIDGPFQGCQLVMTAEHIGIRDGRRIRGLYTVTEQDVARGARFTDAVCRVRFGVDVHSTSIRGGKAFDPNRHARDSQPYDIPLRSMIAADVDGLLMAGRCISGDWIAHASYRVTGEAVAMGQAAGRVAAVVAQRDVLAQDVAWSSVSVG